MLDLKRIKMFMAAALVGFSLFSITVGTASASSGLWLDEIPGDYNLEVRTSKHRTIGRIGYFTDYGPIGDWTNISGKPLKVTIRIFPPPGGIKIWAWVYDAGGYLDPNPKPVSDGVAQVYNTIVQPNDRLVYYLEAYDYEEIEELRRKPIIVVIDAIPLS